MAGDINTSIALELNVDTNAPDAIDQIRVKIAELKNAVAETKKGTDEFVAAHEKLGEAQKLYKNLTQAAKDHQAALQGGTAAYKENRTETRALTGDVLTATKGTSEYNAQLTALAQHRAQFADLRQDIRALDPRQQTLAMARFGETGIRALSGIGGAAALAAGGNEKMMKVMMDGFAITQVMQSAMAIGELKHQAASIKNLVYQKLLTAGYIEEGAAVSGLTIAQGILNAVTAAWPIALVIAGVAAVVGWLASWNMGNEKVAESEQKKIDQLKDERDELDRTAKTQHTHQQNLIDLLTAQGASYETIAAAKEKMRVADLANVNQEIANAEASIRAQIAINKAKASEVPIMAAIWGYTLAFIGLDSGYNAARKKEAEERTKALTEQKDALNDLLNTQEKLAKVAPAQEQKDAADHYKKITDEKVKAKNDEDAKLAKIEMDHFNRVLARNKEFQKQIADDDKRVFDAQTQLIMDEVKKDQDALDLKNENEKIASDKSIANAKREADAKTQIVTSFTEAAVSMGNLLLAKGKEQTDGTKALALIQLGIKEALSIAGIVEAVIAANAETPTPATPFLIAAEIAGGIAGVVATFVSAKSILDGGSGSASAPSISNSTGYTAPSITNSTAFGGAPQLTGTNGQTDYGYNTMSKTYVSQTDLNAAQAKAFYQNLNRRNK